MLLWILNAAGEPERCDDVARWGAWFEDPANRTLRQDYVGDWFVSTVFLGIDHAFGFGEPQLWETMVFGGPLSERQHRWASREAALDGHMAVLAEVYSVARMERVLGPERAVDLRDEN